MRRAYSNALELRRFGRGISWFQEGHSSSSRVTRSRFIALGSRVSSRAPAPENGGGIECRPTSAASTTLGGSAVNGIVSTHSGGGRIEQVPFQVTTARARVLARSAEFQKWFSIAVGTSVYAHAVMLEIAEVGAKISKEEYEEFLPPLRVDLLKAQFQVRGSNLPVMIVLSGDDREAVSEVLNHLHHWMDARYLDAHFFGQRRDHERRYPRFWRYWQVLPAKGEIGI